MKTGLCGSGSSFLRSANDSLVDRPSGDIWIRVPPDLRQKLFTTHYLKGSLRQVLQQLEFMKREANGGTSAQRTLCSEINDDAADLQSIDARACAAKHDFDSGNQLFHVRRFDDVIVGAEPEPLKLVELLAAGRQNDDRHIAVASQ